MSNTNFALSMVAFYCLPTELLQPFVGKHKCANDKLLDEFGDNLILLTNMEGDGWRKRHDVFKWDLSRWMSLARERPKPHSTLSLETEITPSFQLTLPNQSRSSPHLFIPQLVPTNFYQQVQAKSVTTTIRQQDPTHVYQRYPHTCTTY